jgi:signal transduction histidine kinase
MTASAGRIEDTAGGHAVADPGEARRVAVEAGKRSFLRLVSHELRTPLNSIIGFSEIIARELYGPINEPRYREHAEIVRDAGQRLLKLVNDVMELARLEAGLSDLDLQPEDPQVLLEEIATALRPQAAAQEVRLEVIPAAVGLAMADSRATKAALDQLVQNAIAHSPPGGTVRLSLRRTRETIAFDVADEGPGVPIQDLQRIVRPFEQAGSPLTRTTGGAGLGLPIARLLCEAMGGKLRLHSEPGRGLCASVHLPIAP